MATGSGLSTQLMMLKETTVGTPITVTRGFEVDSFTPNNGIITKVSQGLRAGARGHRARNWALTGKAPSVRLTLTAQSKGMGAWLQQMLGGVTTAQIAASLTYRQIHLAADLTGMSATVQGGVAESYSGTVRPYTYNGCKVSDWELSCAMDDLLKLNLTLDAWNWTTATALAAASYLSSLEMFHWAQLSTLVGATASTTGGRTTVTGGAAIKGLRSVSLKGSNNLRVDRRLAGGAGIKSEQLEAGFREYTGDLDLEYADRTQILDLRDAGTTTCLQFTWTGVTSDGSGNFPVLRVTFPAVKFDNGSPESGGPDVNDGKVSFTAFEDDAGTNPLIQIEFESQDTTP